MRTVYQRGQLLDQILCSGTTFPRFEKEEYMLRSREPNEKDRFCRVKAKVVHVPSTKGNPFVLDLEGFNFEGRNKAVAWRRCVKKTVDPDTISVGDMALCDVRDRERDRSPVIQRLIPLETS